MADKQRQFYKNQSGATIFIGHFEMAHGNWVIVVSNCIVGLSWDKFSCNNFFYEHYWRVIMRLFLFLFFIMLKLHKPVILSEKQINKFQIEPKVMWLPIQISLLWKIVSIVLNPSMTTANKVLLQVQVRKHSKKLLQMGIKLLHLIGINIFLVCRDASKPARNSCRNEGFWLWGSLFLHEMVTYLFFF